MNDVSLEDDDSWADAPMRRDPQAREGPAGTAAAQAAAPATAAALGAAPLLSPTR